MVEILGIHIDEFGVISFVFGVTVRTALGELPMKSPLFFDPEGDLLMASEALGSIDLEIGGVTFHAVLKTRHFCMRGAKCIRCIIHSVFLPENGSGEDYQEQGQEEYSGSIRRHFFKHSASYSILHYSHQSRLINSIHSTKIDGFVQPKKRISEIMKPNFSRQP
jgi:hypothetical protein